jgi:hypothetical protein
VARYQRRERDADHGPCSKYSEHIEDTDEPVVFRAACVMGLERIVAKHRE